MGSRLSSHATQPDDSSDDEILLVAPPPPPPPLLDRKQHSAPRPSASSAKVGTKSATKRTLKASPPPESPPSRRKRRHSRWTDETVTAGTIASISRASKVRSAAARPSPPRPEKEVVPDVAAATAPASTTTTTTTTPRCDPTPSNTKRKRVRSPSFELEIFNPPPSQRRAAPIPPAIPTSANPAPPPPPPPPRSVSTTSSASVAVLAPARSTISPDEPNDSKHEQRGSPANKKEVPPASSASRSKGFGDSPLSRRATQAVIRPFDLVAPVVKMQRQRAGSSSESGLTLWRRPSPPPPAGKTSLAPAPQTPTPTPTPLPFPHKSPSHPLNSSSLRLRLKPNPSAPPPPIPVRFLRNDEFEATSGLGGWVMPHPVAAAAAAGAGIVVTGEGKGRKSRVSSASSSASREASLSRSSTPLPATAPAAPATETAAAPALSAAAWARNRYGFLDPAETSHYKIDGSTLGINPDVMSFEWDEDELWDAYEERWGWRERERVARGEEGASEEEEGEEDDYTDNHDDDEDSDAEEEEEHQKRSSSPPQQRPRARMAFTLAAATTTEEEGPGEGRLLMAGTEVVARLCHLASATEGAVHPSDRLSALSQLDAMSRGGAVLQVPWRWKSLEEGQGRASNLAGMVEGKGKWATRNPFMRGTEEESGRGAHRWAKEGATAVANTRGGGGMASSRPRAAAARRRTLFSSSTSTSTSSSRASSVDSDPIVDVASAAVTGALYGIDETRPPRATGSAPAPFAATATQLPHLGSFLLSGPSSLPPPSPASIASHPAAPVAASSASPAAIRLETSSEGAAVIRSIHDISSNANATLLGAFGAPSWPNKPGRGAAATASSIVESNRVWPARRSRPEKPPTTVRSPDGVASASTSSTTTNGSSSRNGNGLFSSRSSSSSDRDDHGSTSASSSGPEAGPLTARLVHPPLPPSAPIATVRSLAPPVVPTSMHAIAPVASSASGSRPVAPPNPLAETPKKPPTVKRATTPSGMVRCNHVGCPSPFYHPHKRSALENHARNFHTPGVVLSFRDPDRTHYLVRDPKTGALQCPFCSFWSMNASSTKQHVYRRSDCLGPPARSCAG